MGNGLLAGAQLWKARATQSMTDASVTSPARRLARARFAFTPSRISAPSTRSSFESAPRITGRASNQPSQVRDELLAHPPIDEGDDLGETPAIRGADAGPVVVARAPDLVGVVRALALEH